MAQRRRARPLERLTQARAHLLACHPDKKLRGEDATLAEHQFKGRREDLRLVTGRGRYTTDNNVNGQAAAHFLRADRAHARIVKVDIEAARKQPGVLDIVTGADIVATGWKTPPVLSFFKGVGGSSLRVPFRAGLAHDRVRFVGEPVALVVAETEHLAQDAAELIEIEYEDLPVIVEAADGVAVRRHPRARRAARQSGAGLRIRRPAEHRAGICRRRARRPRRAARAAHCRQSDGAEVLPRAVRRGQGAVRALGAEPGHRRSEELRWRRSPASATRNF